MTGSEFSFYFIGTRSVECLLEDKVHSYIVKKNLESRLEEGAEKRIEIKIRRQLAIEDDVRTLKYILGLSIIIGIIDTIADNFRSNLPLSKKYIYWAIIGGVSIIAGVGSYTKVKYDVYRIGIERSKGIRSTIRYFWGFGRSLSIREIVGYGFIGAVTADLAWYPARQAKDLIFEGDPVTYDFPIYNHWYEKAFPNLKLFGVHYGDPTIVGGIPLVHVLTAGVILIFLSYRLMFSNKIFVSIIPHDTSEKTISSNVKLTTWAQRKSIA